MKSFFGNAIAKKTVSLILILAVAAMAFASPLKTQAGFGDAKVYDSTYKAVRNPQEILDNYVIRTSSSAVVLNGGKISVEVEGNSLLQFISLGDKAALQGFFQETAIIVTAQINIHTRFQSHGSGFSRIGGHMLGGIDGIDSVKVRKNNALEVPRVA